MASRRVLVTGASGFVGANLARRLLHEGLEVHVLLRSHRPSWRLDGIRADLRIHSADLGDAETVTAAVKAARPQWAFHTAVHGAYPFQTAIRDMIRTNIVGTVNLVQACLAVGVEALVNTGSSSEYGFKDHAPSEEEALSPNSDYAVTKASATLYCRQVARTADMHVPTLRLYSVYGPFEEPSRLIPTLIVHGLAGTLPPLVNPAVARDFVFVDDAIEAYLLAASLRSEERGPVYNVGTGVQSTLAEVVDTARDLLHIGVVPAWGSLRAREWDTNV